MKKLVCPKCGKKAELITDHNHPILSCKCRLTKAEYDKADEDEMFENFVALTEDGMSPGQALIAVCR
jgi:hypothetical protein